MPAACCFHIHGKKVSRPGSPAEALALLDKDGFIWLDFDDPTPDQLAALAAPLGLHPLSIEDCFDDNQVPKVEEFEQYNFVLFNTIIMPLTLLAGIGGMSEWSMMTGPHNWPIAYPLLLLGMLILAGSNWVVLKWARWI